MENVFTDIYHYNAWGSGKSISGPGSETAQTKIIIEELKQFLHKKGISSILDIPCGDFNWMNKVINDELRYVGGDIVKPLILKNKIDYKNRNNCKFIISNLINDDLPSSDLIINRDCLVHFSYADIFLAIKNIKKSKSKFILTTTFTNKNRHNIDIETGSWRAINLQQAPFNFPKPLLIINENCQENNGIYQDKSLGLWAIKKLP